MHLQWKVVDLILGCVRFMCSRWLWCSKFLYKTVQWNAFNYHIFKLPFGLSLNIMEFITAFVLEGPVSLKTGLSLFLALFDTWSSATEFFLVPLIKLRPFPSPHTHRYVEEHEAKLWVGKLMPVWCELSASASAKRATLFVSLNGIFLGDHSAWKGHLNALLEYSHVFTVH